MHALGVTTPKPLLLLDAAVEAPGADVDVPGVEELAECAGPPAGPTVEFGVDEAGLCVTVEVEPW